MINRLILLLPCLYIILIPVTHILPSIGMYNEKRLFECLLLLLLSSLLILSSQLRQRWLDTFLQLPQLARYALACLFILGLLSALSAESPRHALLEVGLISLLFIACLLVATAYRSSKPDIFNKTVIATLAIAGLAYLTLFFAGFIAASTEATKLIQTALFGNFSHLRFFGQFQSWTLALIILPLLLIKPHQRLLFATALFIAIGWWLLAFASGTRGTLLGILTAFIIVAIAYRQQAKHWFVWQGMALFSGLLLYIIFFVILPIFNADSASSSTVLKGTVGRELSSPSGRFGLWHDAWEMIATDPLLGAGPMSYACDLSHRAAHPHNTSLQLAAEWGLPAALILMGLALWGGLHWLRSTRATTTVTNQFKKTLPVALLASLTTAAIHAQFSGLLIMPLSQVLFILIVGWMIGQRLPQVVEPMAGQSLWGRISIIVIPIMSIILLLQGSLPNTLHLNELEETFQLNHPSPVLSPRFWQQGRICD